MTITRFGVDLYGHHEHLDNVEGSIPQNASVTDRQLYAPPTDKEELSALRAEVHFLRQVLYHKATHAEEREYARYRRMTKSISTSTIAQIVNRIAATGFGTSYLKPVKLPPQFIFRWTYKIIEILVGSSEVRWGDKPAGLSKLKWLWQNNLLFMMPFAINAIEAVIHTMTAVDQAGTLAILKKLEQQLSKPKSKP